MIREVVLTQRAEQQLHATADWYAQSSPKVADDWFNGVIAAMKALRKTPEKFPLAHENDDFPFVLREMLFGLGRRMTHRVLFVVHRNRVMIHQVRHVAQSDMTPGDE